MNEGVIVHCPRCGAAMHVQPVVDQTSFSGDHIRFTFNYASIEHGCEA